MLGIPDLGEKVTTTDFELADEEQFDHSIKRNEEGRYVISLP